MAQPTQTTKRARITTPSDTEIRIERTFDAPRALVWRAYTDPALLAKWLGPNRLVTRIMENDFRVGGKWRFVHADTDGTEYGFHGEFLEIVPERRITQTWVFEGMPEASSVQTMELTEKDGRTTVVAIAKYKEQAHRDGHIANGMEIGVNEGYERLDAILRTMA